MKIDRLISILLTIIEKKKVTAEELSNTFEVSVRTIQRDIDDLCNAGVPIYGEVGKNGGYHITENYKLDKNYITKKEITTLVDILSGFKDTLFKGSVRDLLSKFSIFNDSIKSNRKFVIDTTPWGINVKRQNQKLEEIQKATEQTRYLLFDYTDLNKNMTRRKIEPYTIIMKGNSWYLYGYCTFRNDYRLFNINRIVNLKIENIFTERENIKPIGAFNIDQPRTPIEIILQTKTSFTVPEYLNPIEEKILKENKRQIKCSVPLDEWLYSILMSLSNEFEIIEPLYVREEIINRIKESLKIYKL